MVNDYVLTNIINSSYCWYVFLNFKVVLYVDVTSSHISNVEINIR